MALASLGAISSILVAGPSGTKSAKETERSNSERKSNPFDAEPKETKSSKKAEARKKAAALINFNNYKATHKLKESKCDEKLDFNCQSTYVYYPDSTKLEQCEDVRKSLNIPEDYGFCDNTPYLSTPKMIKAEDLENFVGIKSKKK